MENTKIDLLLNVVCFQILGKHKFKKVMLIEGSKKDNEIDAYIKVLETYIQNTKENIESEFKFLTK